LIEQDQKMLIHKRSSSGIWGGLHEFPNVESTELEILPIEFLEELGITSGLVEVKAHTDFKHLLTHQTIFARCWHLSPIPNNIVLSKSYFLVNNAEIRTFPMHKLMLKILNNLNL
jgi:A/G-specific adenine glycosylase